MKTLIFANGIEIPIAECYSDARYVQGAQRDVLDFRFDASTVSMDYIDTLFTADDCATLTIRETTEVDVTIAGENGDTHTETQIRTAEYVHKNYGLRVALSKQFYTLATENGAEDKEQISVKMGQLTYTEMQVAALQASSIALEDAICEMDAANEERMAAIEDALCEIDMG